MPRPSPSALVELKGCSSRWNSSWLSFLPLSVTAILTPFLELISTHLDIVKLAVYRNGTLRANFFRDIWRVEAMRKHFDQNEVKLFREVLKEGKEQGLFDIDNVEITADILHYCIKGIEVPYIRGQIGEDLDDEIGWRYVAKIVYGALGRKE